MISPLACLLVLALGATSSQALSGTFALQAGRSQTQGHMVATQIGTSPLDQRLDLWLTREPSQTVSHYDVTMTKYLHLIAISDDLTTFLHVHPTLDDDHHFRIDMQFPREGLYHLYADDEPDGIGQQVFRYELRVGSRLEQGRSLVPTGSQVTAGPYRVALGATRLRVGSENELAVHITKNGNPANDLHPYLGALAHAVFIAAGDLSYAHVHPMPLRDSKTSGMPAMNGMPAMSASGDMRSAAAPKPLSASQTSSPDMLLHVRVREAGMYKLWLQFRGSDGLYAAPFVVTADSAQHNPSSLSR